MANAAKRASLVIMAIAEMVSTVIMSLNHSMAKQRGKARIFYVVASVILILWTCSV